MQESKYLTSGEKLGGHYEIVEVLGEDEFEILYLVKDKHLGEKLFVLKELFFQELSLRDFEKIKKEVISEIERLQKDSQNRDIKTYGYFEENDTVYTIMEFVNNPNLEHYLTIKTVLKKYNSQIEEEISLPSLEEEPKKKKSKIFLKILIVSVLIFMGLAYYAFKIIKEDKEKSQDKPSNTTVEVISNTPKPLNHPPLKVREKNESKVTENIEKNETETKTEVVTFDETEYIEENLSSLEGVPEAEIYYDTEIKPEEQIFSPLELSPPEEIPIQEENKFQVAEEFNRVTIKSFLDRFTNALSNGSITSILLNYDSYVNRYFLLNGVTSVHIRNERSDYNEKWKNRDFKINNFVILKMYQKNGIEYCNIATTIKWSVSTQNMGADFGKSRGLITLKKTTSGFKIVSITSK